MQSFLLQDWTTIRGTDMAPIVQAKSDWLDLEPFADVVFWVQIAEVSNPGTGSVSMVFETAPVPLDSVFLAIDTIDQLASSNNAKLAIRKAFMNGVGGVPLARFLRWKLVGTATGSWDVTFRIFVTVGTGVRSAFCPLALKDLVLWLRADQGVALSAGKASQWSDLSGYANHATQGVSASQPTLVPGAINGRPALDFSAFNVFMDTTAANLFPLGGSPYSVMLVAKNGSGALFTLRRSATYSASKFQSTTTTVYGDGSLGSVTVPDTSSETHSSSVAFKSLHRYRGSGQTPDIFLNGTARTATGTQTLESGGNSGYVIAADATVGDAWSGLIAEIIVVRGAISDPDRLRVEAYQKDFFGI